MGEGWGGSWIYINIDIYVCECVIQLYIKFLSGAQWGKDGAAVGHMGSWVCSGGNVHQSLSVCGSVFQRHYAHATNPWPQKVKFSKVLCRMTLYCNYIRALTFENFLNFFVLWQSAPDVPKEVPAEARAFITQCFCFDPSNRPSAHRLLKHPFLQKYEKSCSESNQTRSSLAGARSDASTLYALVILFQN